jgi:hypothetical protein
MFESDLAMNGKPHSKQIKDYMNPLCQGFTKSHSSWVRMVSDRRDLKNILMTISPQTTSDPSWEASAW